MNIRESKEYLEFGYKIVRCPVCRNETLDNHFICPTCGWEYDGIESGWSDANDILIEDAIDDYHLQRTVETMKEIINGDYFK